MTHWGLLTPLGGAVPIPSMVEDSIMLKAQKGQQVREVGAQDVWLPRFPGLSCMDTGSPGVLSMHATLANSLRTAETSVGQLGKENALRPHFSLGPLRAPCLRLSLEKGFSLWHCPLWGCLHLSHGCTMFQNTPVWG